MLHCNIYFYMVFLKMLWDSFLDYLEYPGLSRRSIILVSGVMARPKSRRNLECVFLASPVVNSKSYRSETSSIILWSFRPYLFHQFTIRTTHTSKIISLPYFDCEYCRLNTEKSIGRWVPKWIPPMPQPCWHVKCCRRTIRR